MNIDDLKGCFANITDDDLLRDNGNLYAENKELKQEKEKLQEDIEEIKEMIKLILEIVKKQQYISQMESNIKLQRRMAGIPETY